MEEVGRAPYTSSGLIGTGRCGFPRDSVSKAYTLTASRWGGAYNVEVCGDCGPFVCRSEGHVEVDEDASVAVPSALRTHEDIVVRDIPVEDPEIVSEQPLVTFKRRQGYRSLNEGAKRSKYLQ